jgi:hypothetical protein
MGSALGCQRRELDAEAGGWIGAPPVERGHRRLAGNARGGKPRSAASGSTDDSNEILLGRRNGTWSADPGSLTVPTMNYMQLVLLSMNHSESFPFTCENKR